MTPSQRFGASQQQMPTHRVQPSYSLSTVPMNKEEELNFWIEPAGSARGTDLLHDRDGNTYERKDRPTNGRCVWKCTKRSVFGKTNCPAIVNEENGQFSVGKRDHLHDSNKRKYYGDFY